MLPLMKSAVRFEEKTIKQFKGINVRENYTSGEICEEVNMSSEMYPALCTRNPRSLLSPPVRNITGIGNCEGLIYTHTAENGKMFLNYKGTDYDFTSLTTKSANEKRTFAALSDCIMMIPDNLIFTPSEGTFKAICVNQLASHQTASSKYSIETKGNKLSGDLSDSYIGFVSNNSITSRKLAYSSSGTSYNFYYLEFDKVLKAGDIITVKLNVKSDKAGNDDAYKEYRNKMEQGITLKIKDVKITEHKTLNGAKTETTELLFDDYAIDDGGYSDLALYEIEIERTVPALKDICSYNNRIWGITDSELRCSKLSDASEWNDFTVDSYGTLPYACFTSPAPTEGKFTSILSFGNYIYAFKENAIHKLYGDNPDEFVLKTIEVNGVSESKKLTVAKGDSAVFYCSYDGIYKFDGTGSVRISECLDDGIDFKCAGCDGKKYYAHSTQNGKEYIYVYDIKRGLWHREDSEEGIEMFCRSKNDVYASDGSMLILINPDTGEPESNKPQWNFSVRFDEKTFEKNIFGKLSVRYSLGKDAFFTVRAIYDDGSHGAVCGAKHDEAPCGGGVMRMPLRRCTSFTLQFRGKGFFCLKSLRTQYYRGSEI